jgi:hypothetical protein
MHAVLQEAARYEPETSVPGDLVRAALAQHDRFGRRCDERRPVPLLVAGACGLALLVSGGLWLRLPRHRFAGFPTSAPVTAFLSGQKVAASPSFPLPGIDFTPALLPPIDMTNFLPARPLAPPARIARHFRRHGQRIAASQIHPAPSKTLPTHSVWTTETVHTELVTQTVTPVWVAQADPETSTVILTPALFQLALQPDNPSDPTETEVSAALIPVRFAQENPQP